MSKKYLFFLIIAAVLLAEPLGVGLTRIKTSAGVYFENTNLTADAASDSIYSKWYSIEHIGAYNNLRVVFDSVRGACTVAVDLQESWDGNAVEFTTNLLTIYFAQSRLDTVVKVNFYPAPYMRLLFREVDATAGESLQIDTVSLFSHQ